LVSDTDAISVLAHAFPGCRVEKCTTLSGNRLGVLAPKPCFVDRDEGALVLEYVEGAPELPRAPSSDMLRQMATELARLHAVPLPLTSAF
jgi:hypothetical protein